jgi:hypothetical protein
MTKRQALDEQYRNPDYRRGYLRAMSEPILGYTIKMYRRIAKDPNESHADRMFAQGYLDRAK